MSEVSGHASALFAARWTTRLQPSSDLSVVFSSYASGGSRIMVDNTIVMDAFEEFGSTFSTDPVPLSAGYHYLAYEYRSADSTEAGDYDGLQLCTAFERPHRDGFQLHNLLLRQSCTLQ